MKTTNRLRALALVVAALLSGCKEDKPQQVTIEFMHSSVEQERQAVIRGLIDRFQKENPTITVKQVPVEEDAFNTKMITLARSGALPEVIEVSHDYARVMDKESLIDHKAVKALIEKQGEASFYDGVLRIVRTEDGNAYTGVPISAWLQGIWYRKSVLAKAGISEPKNWAQLLDAARKLTKIGDKKYGIALPTAESVMTEQTFSQFALSNHANVFNADGKVTVNSPEMLASLNYYRDLSRYTMPGSNNVMEIKDAFMNETAPMAVYSTYILPAIAQEGSLADIGFVVPTEKTSAVYGVITSLTITTGQKEEETEAAEKFVSFMEQAQNTAEWVLMSPGAMLPVTKAVAAHTVYKDNPAIKAFGDLTTQLIAQYPHMQVFGSVGEKNFTGMGDVTGSAILSEMVNQVTVGKQETAPALERSQQRVAELLQRH
ncbi:multiple sugar transport system periplasmic sugar-binding protein [Enterobacter hormaechei]|jgi:multiple sugar transport system substrate-binding protein|uniref:Extracellular solute-binding protein n=3 Tax=Enterobacter hormaechei TaxID=158836 RepID=A0AAE4J1D4_9ENTR|nr:MULTISPECIES: extracellular solute-binding protein [Enterobacter]CAE7303077.1 Multiple sugar-binding protein [Enterobacter cloacae]VAL56297.1 multiple sugar transport system periplasmic sugar-binding protein [Enterobacter kobei]AWV77039.1 sugar ABC transporter substrate-binding protein [Enterobacter hormaechei subsp. xiangfangensis]EHF5035877.1 extracellular solute-binding protein [Enterobacter hormaechei]EKV5135805.1 extracellular solute-binding protein [Enterobacter hormaechei]